MLPHQVMLSFSAMSRFAMARRPDGGAASSTRWNPVSPVSSMSARIRFTINSEFGSSYRPM
jgi:hypothetical protein